MIFQLMTTSNSIPFNTLNPLSYMIDKAISTFLKDLITFARVA